MQRVAGLVFTAFVVVLAVATVGVALNAFSVAVDLVIALLGVVFLIGSALSLLELGQRVHQLTRFVFADVRDGSDTTTLTPGAYWLRIEATMTAQDDPVYGVLDDDPAVAVTVEGSVRERFANLPWLSKQVGTHFEETDATPATLGQSIGDSVFAATGTPRTIGHDVRVVGGDRRNLTSDDDISPHTRDSLAGFDIDVSHDLFSGRVFEHYVRITEATVRNGETVQLFGPVTVEASESGRTLTPGGRFTSRPLLTTEGWGCILKRIGRRLAILALLAPLTGVCGLLLLSMAGISLPA